MRRAVIAVFAVAVLALAFFGGREFGRSDGGAQEASSTTSSDSAEAGAKQNRAEVTTPRTDAAVAPTAGTSASASTNTAAWPPLPPPGTRIADVFDELADRARRGDAAAGCRLALELQRCRFAQGQSEMLESMQAHAARLDETPERLVQAIADLERQQQPNDAACGGLQPAQYAQTFDFQRLAANGRPDLRTWFVLNPALERRDFVGELERWAEYRRVALPWLEEAARSGDVVALIALARVHGDLRRNSPPIPPFRIDDPVRALAYNDALIRLGLPHQGLQLGAAAARERLDADGLARAADLAQAMLDRQAPGQAREAFETAMTRSFTPNPTPSDCEPRL